MTNNFRFMYLLKENLSDIKDIKIKHILPKELTNIPKNTDVIITTEKLKDKVETSKIFVPKSFNKVYLYSNILRIKEKKEQFQEIIVGIDPGKTTGIVILSEEGIIETGVYNSALKIVKVVLSAFLNIKTKSFRIKIGEGATKMRDEILERLNKIFKGKVIIDIVKEGFTTKGNNRRNKEHSNKHIKAAILIAKRQ